jgi:poly-gamma-glutamate synthase PgsB/CapB
MVAAAFTLAAVLRWWWESRAHVRRMRTLLHRIHVNGIRGKSTVTRLIAGMLREANYTTIAKSTGSAAAVIDRDGIDIPIERNGPPTILEQIDVVRDYVTPDVDALVIECMAVNPVYQSASERAIVRSSIGVITNVREDHQDVMGETLPEIARSLLSTCPDAGVLITSEQNRDLLAVMGDEAAKRGSSLLVADPTMVSDEELGRFDYISFKENIAIALVLAEHLGIDRDVAMRGMVAAAPDPGVLRLLELEIGDKKVTWANLFAVNDRESMIVAYERLRPYVTSDTTTVGILNNRSDRQRRAIQFADVAVHDLRFDRLVTFGAYESHVTERILRNGYDPNRVINLGEERNPSVDEIIQRTIHDMPTGHVLLVGFVNIHTHQAELMLEYFEHRDAPGTAPSIGHQVDPTPTVPAASETMAG